MITLGLIHIHFQKIKLPKGMPAHQIKLTNLPYNTSARDLTDIIKTIDTKACYISRSSNYKSKPFAILFFENADKLNDAVKQNFAYGENNLAWVAADAKVCHKCSNPKHLAINCPKIPNRFSNDTSSP